MPHEMKFKIIPAGFGPQPIRGPCYLWICTKEFVSSEDGALFVDRLEGMGQMLFPAITPSLEIIPARVNHYLAIIRPDSTGTMYINELDFRSKILPKRSFETGQPVSFDDIADVREMCLYLHDEHVVVPADCGVVLFFSVGWRRGLFYDLDPLSPDSGTPRDYDIETQFGQCYAYLGFQSRLQITKPEWDEMLRERWFPFISLKTGTIQEILGHVRNGRSVDDLLERIHQEVLSGLEAELSKWGQHPFFGDHLDLLKQAVNRYRAGDYISAVSILFPRIEGILRGYHRVSRSGEKISQSALVQAAVDNNPNVQHKHSLLLPTKFRDYLLEIFFENFDPEKPENLTRHTVAHGVAPATDFNLKGATLGFLILQQLSYYLFAPDVRQA